MDGNSKDGKIREFSEVLTEEMKATADASGEDKEIAFLEYVGEKLRETKLLNDPSFFYWKLTFQRQEIELYGYDIDEVDNSISLFFVDFGEPYHQIAGADLTKNATHSIRFIQQSLEKKPEFINKLESEAFDLYDQVCQLSGQSTGIAKIRVIYLSNGKRSNRARTSLDLLSKQNIDVDILIWDTEWLYINCDSDKEADPVDIDIAESGYEQFAPGLMFLEVPQNEKLFACYQCIVPGSLLSKAYREYGSPLLEGNVRSFLTTKTDVNKKIQATIQKEPDRFYIYNNGIAAIASNVEFSVVEGQRYITKICHFQIVNGGQTTASLAYSEQKRGADLSQISVPMKLTVINPDDKTRDNLDRLIQKVSETSNSQNKVSDVDFFANSPFHMEMKGLSERLMQPGLHHGTWWFYERARGEYKQGLMFKTAKEQETFIKSHPKEKYLTKTDFAKYYNIWKIKPNIVSKGAASNFKDFAGVIDSEWKTDKAMFNELFFKSVVAVATMYRTLEPAITPKQASWYNGSYRANIIVYALSYFFYFFTLHQDVEFNLMLIWDKDGISDTLKSDLLRLCEAVYKIITDPNRPVENVTQWCKQSKCWDSVKSKLSDFLFDEIALTPYLVSTEEVREKKKSATKSQRIINEVNMYNFISVSPYKGNWKKLQDFISSNSNLFNLSSNDKSSLTRMVKLSLGQYTSLNTSDVQKCLDLWNDAEALGFKV